ncbi:MAG: hypothetical protein LQ338_004443 [Usnochroma carphineum]|nr:MAG: hypothetical protein LQ338_004443 [Usnochroma carphineum]
MFTSRIRGGTPISDEDAQLPITDPALLADLEDINQHFRTQRALRLQAAVTKANIDYQPPPDIHTPDREDSPSLNGLPTPSSSPLPSYPKLQRTQLQPPATDKPAFSQPATCIADLGLLAEFEALSELSRRRRAQQIQAAVVPNREDSSPLGGHLSPTFSLHFDQHNSPKNEIPRTATSDLHFEIKPDKNLPTINDRHEIESIATYNLRGIGQLCRACPKHCIQVYPSKEGKRLSASGFSFHNPPNTLYRISNFPRREEAQNQEVG